MGKVWVAEHLVLDTEVVVKFMANVVSATSDAAARFTSEAAAIAAVKSPHVVTVFDSGVTPSGVPYHVMELLDGRDLGAHLDATGPMKLEDVAIVLAHLAKALGKAHRLGIVHRDVKPENVFLCNTEGEIFVKLLDFGTAKRDLTAPTTTTTGQLLGTPYYMSPEQIVGEKDIDARTDIWSLGVVVFEAITGKRPFDGATVGALTLAIHSTTPRVTDAAPHLPAALDAWFAKACARAPADRFASVRELADAFVRAIDAKASPRLELDLEVDSTSTKAAPVATADEGGAPARSPAAANDEPPRTVSALAATLAPARTPRRTIWLSTVIATAVLVLAFASIARRRAENEAAANAATPTSTSAVRSAAADPPSPRAADSRSSEAPATDAKTAAAPRAAEAPPRRAASAPAPASAPRAARDDGLPVFIERDASAPRAPAAAAPDAAAPGATAPPAAPEPPPLPSSAPPETGTAPLLEILPPAAPRENLAP
jgi:serine/threonine-protein kinase